MIKYALKFKFIASAKYILLTIIRLPYVLVL